MKKTLLISLLTVIFGSINAQNLTVENQYLLIVNNQYDKYLIKDNIRNAELCVDSLLLIKKQENFPASDFLLNLTNSYYLIKKYDYALFSLLRQKILFPSNILQNKSKLLFNKIIIKYRKKIDTEELLEKTNYEEIIRLSEQEKIILLIELSFKLKSKRINDELWRIVENNKKILTEKNPFWLEQWILFNTIDLKYRKQLKYVDFAKIDTNYLSIENLVVQITGNDKKKILKKSKLYNIK